MPFRTDARFFGMGGFAILWFHIVAAATAVDAVKGVVMSNEEQRDLVLGTAGHIDHGKSSLIYALTGTDPDRLEEEKERGITITLGFAKLVLPDGRSMGVVDLPGHEKFVRQMISGATGIDIALLVIATDDGVMPQTVEHVTILQTLGIRSCVVALTKIDLVDDPEWIEFVADDVRERLASTPYANAPIIPVSSKTGEGLDELRQAIQDAAEATDRTHSGNAIRYPIDRVFTIKGSGTVLTGTLWSGIAHPGDDVEILPSKKACKIRTIQIHGNTVDAAYSGNRVAINLRNVKTSEVQPGDFLASVGAIEPSDRFDAFVTYIDNDKTGKSLASGSRVHIAHGTREVIGRILFMDGLGELEPGESSMAQIRLEKPLAVSYSDRFVMRTYSPVHLAGGGIILLAHPRRRTTLDEGERKLLEALHAGNEQAAVNQAVANEQEPVTSSFIARLIGIEPKRADALLRKSAEAGAIVSLGSDGQLYASEEAIVRATRKIETALKTFHAEHPKEAGAPKEALRRKCFPKMTTPCFDSLLARAVEDGVAVVSDGVVQHPDAWSSAQAVEADLAEEFAAALAGTGLTPPTLQDLASEAGVDVPVARKAMMLLCRQNRAWCASPDLFFDMEPIEHSKQVIAQHFAAGGEGTVAALRDALGTSRKYIVPLLESFDRANFTRRTADNLRRLV